MKSPYVRVVCLVFISACGLMTPYKPPEPGAPSASLTVVNSGNGNVTFWPYSNAANCTGLLDVQSFTYMNPGTRAEIAVAAGQDFSIGSLQDAGYAQATKSCTPNVTFRPEAGKRYVATYFSDREGCDIKIQRESTDGGAARLVDEPSFKRRKRVDGVTKSYCE